MVQDSNYLTLYLAMFVYYIRTSQLICALNQFDYSVCGGQYCEVKD